MLMMTRFLFCFAMVVIVATVCTEDARADILSNGLALTTFVGSRMFRLNVTSEPEEPLSAILEIECVFGCQSNSSLIEKIQGSLIQGAYPVEDGIVTLWAVGDGGLVRIYHVDGTGVRKVLETSIRGQYPIRTSTKDGRSAFIIQEKTAGDLLRDQKKGIIGPTYPVQGDLWVWNGHEYIKDKAH